MMIKWMKIGTLLQHAYIPFDGARSFMARDNIMEIRNLL